MQAFDMGECTADRTFRLMLNSGCDALSSPASEIWSDFQKVVGLTSLQKTCPHRVVVSATASSKHSGHDTTSWGLAPLASALVTLAASDCGGRDSFKSLAC